VKSLLRIRSLHMYADRFGAVLIGGLITGILAGILLRVIMKIIALAFPHMARGLTIGGILALMIIGMIFTLAISLYYALISPLLPYKWWLKGLIFGGTILIVFGIPFFFSNPDNDLFGPQAPLSIALFSLLFLFGGCSLAFCTKTIENWAVNNPLRRRWIVRSFYILIIPAIFMVVSVVSEFIGETIPSIRQNWF